MTVYRIVNDAAGPRLPVLIVEHVPTHTFLTAPGPGEEPHYLWRQYQNWLAAGGEPEPLKTEGA